MGAKISLVTKGLAIMKLFAIVELQVQIWGAVN